MTTEEILIEIENNKWHTVEVMCACIGIDLDELEDRDIICKALEKNRVLKIYEHIEKMMKNAKNFDPALMDYGFSSIWLNDATTTKKIDVSGVLSTMPKEGER